MSRPALGRGLSALLGGKPAPTPVSVPPEGADAAPPLPAVGGDPVSTQPNREDGRVERVAVNRLRPSELQPRKDFPAGSLQELADSIRQQGILQPLVARRQGEFLELIAGERRWRAAQLAGLAEVPVIVRDVDDPTALELMLVENLQREDLNPMDEAQGYAELIQRFALTQESAAARVGRSRAAVANALRLLRLPSEVQSWVRDGSLATGHAKVILGLESPETQVSASRQVIAERLSVRQAEELVTRLATTPPAPATPASKGAPTVTVRDPHVVSVEDKLRQRLGTKVTLRYRQGRGQIDIRFFSDDELERVLGILGVETD